MNYNKRNRKRHTFIGFIFWVLYKAIYMLFHFILSTCQNSHPPSFYKMCEKSPVPVPEAPGTGILHERVIWGRHENMLEQWFPNILVLEPLLFYTLKNY